MARQQHKPSKHTKSAHTPTKSNDIDNKKRKSPEDATPTPPQTVSETGMLPRGSVKTSAPQKSSKSRPGGQKTNDPDTLFAPKTKKQKTHKNSDRVQEMRKAAHEGIPRHVVREEFSNKKQKEIPALSVKDLVVNMPCLGCIKEIRQSKLMVVLPNGINAMVPLAEISEGVNSLLSQQPSNLLEDELNDILDEPSQQSVSLSSLFRLGQFVGCSVTQLGDAPLLDNSNAAIKHNISVSLLSSRVNLGVGIGDVVSGQRISGSLRSKEDHGWIVSLGLSDQVSGFLLFENATQFEAARASPLRVGEILFFWILRVKRKDQTIVLTLDAPKSEHALDANDNGTLRTIKPGVKLMVTVRRIVDTGLMVSYTDDLRGSIHVTHIPGAMIVNDTIKWQALFTRGHKIMARVLYVSTNRKHIGLSLLPHVMSLDGSEIKDSLPPYAMVLQKVPVCKIVPNVGLFVKLPESVASINVSAENNNNENGNMSDDENTQKNNDSQGDDNDDNSDSDSSDDDGDDDDDDDDDDDGDDDDSDDGSEVDLAPKNKKGKRAFQEADDDENVLDFMTDKSKLGFIHIGHLSDSDRPKLGSFKGKSVTCRVVGFDWIDGVALLDMRQSTLKKPMARLEDLKPGQVVVGNVSKVEGFGMIVELASNLRALCPTVHLSDTSTNEPLSSSSKKGPQSFSRFMARLNKKMKFRIVSVDRDRFRVIVTAKKSIVSSELPIIANYDQKVDTESHGWVLGVKPELGVVVGFFGGVRGLVRKQHLGKQFTTDPNSMFKVGQVVKCKVVSCKPDKHKLVLSLCDFEIAADESDDDEKSKGPEIGQILTAKVVELDEEKQTVRVDCDGKPGSIKFSQLCDHSIHLDQTLALLETGSEISAVVLAIPRSQIFLSAKPSLLAAARAGQIVREFTDLHVGMVLDGVVQNIQNWGVFVGFFGLLVGLAPRTELADKYVANASDLFEIGQSVRAVVTTLDETSRKIGLTLKPSKCFPTADSSFVNSFFEESHRMLALTSGQATSLVSRFPVGTIVRCKIEQIKAYGYIMSVVDNQDIKAFAHSDHVTGKAEVGQVVEAVILDVDENKKILDVSGLPKLVDPAKAISKKKHRAELPSSGQTIACVVELVKTHYLVVSLPKFNHTIACVCASNFNAQAARLHDSFEIGQEIAALMYSDDKEETAVFSRVLTYTPPVPSTLVAGRVVTCIVSTSILPKQGMPVEIPTENRKIQAHLFPTLITRDKTVKFPTKLFAKGASIEAVVLQAKPLVLTTIPEAVSAINSAKEAEQQQVELQKLIASLLPNRSQLSQGDEVWGVVREAKSGGVSVSLAPAIKGFINREDENGVELYTSIKQGHEMFPMGSTVICTIKQIEEESIGLTLKHRIQQAFAVGDQVTGVITKIIPDECLIVSVNGLGARVFITDIDDEFVDKPLQRFAVGKSVTASVIRCTDSKIDLSLRPSRVTNTAPTTKLGFTEVQSVDDVKVGHLIQGYVRDTSTKGCFVNISSCGLVGRVQLKNLSDKFVTGVGAALPKGKRVVARVLSTDDGKVELSIKGSDVIGGQWRYGITDLQKGMKVKGFVRAIAKFGLFITLKHSDVVGFCHTSEVSEKHIEELGKHYSCGDYVKAVVLSVNLEKKQAKLSLKASWFTDDDKDDSSDDEDDDVGDTDMFDADDNASSNHGSDDAVDDDNNNGVNGDDNNDDDGDDDGDDDDGDDDDDDGDDDNILEAMSESSNDSQEDLVASARLFKDDDDNDDDDNDDDDDDNNDNSDEDSSSDESMDSGEETKQKPIGFQFGNLGFQNTQPKSDSGESESESSDDDDDEQSKRKKQQEKRKQKSKHQALIDKAEEENADGQMQSADDFEKQLMGQPNSSMLWIGYMAFQLSLTEIDKARQIAERALKTILFKEEKERLNLWVAYLNLELSYGTPESVKSTFVRARENCDAQEISLRMLDIYLKNKNNHMAEELLTDMVKRFSDSVRVWQAYIQFRLRSKEYESAQALLQRALQTLPKRQHIEIIARFGKLLFEHGSPERGRTVFEGIVTNYPKRTDLWSVYLDMEVKHGNHTTARQLFERAICLSLPPKMIKFFFKKYLDFEGRHGSDETVESVKQKARDYVASVIA